MRESRAIRGIGWKSLSVQKIRGMAIKRSEFRWQMELQKSKVGVMLLSSDIPEGP